MKYDFDTIINRRNTNSHKWDYQDTQLPMWLGDMDFKTAPEIIQELDKRVQHGIFGYALIPDDFFQAYINWWDRRHDFKIEKRGIAIFNRSNAIYCQYYQRIN